MANSPDEPYRTTDFYLAAYLRAAGFPFGPPEFDPTTRRATFVFLSVDPQVIVDYTNGSETHRVSAQGLIRAIRETKELLYNWKPFTS